MKYYVVYDLNDNIVAYCDTEDEVVNFTGIDKYNLRRRLKNGFCYYQFKKTYRKIYVF